MAAPAVVGALEDHDFGVRGWPLRHCSHVFLCGNATKNEEMVQLLSNAGLREHRHKEPGEVYVERF